MYIHVRAHLVKYVVQVRLLIQDWNVILKTQLHIRMSIILVQLVYSHMQIHIHVSMTQLHARSI